MNPVRRRAIFRRLQAANPAPTTELEHSTPFELLVAVMLSAHTTDRSVNAATRQLFPRANTPQAILALGPEGLLPYLKSVGLYNSKTKNLLALCRQLIEKHGGEIPSRREDLEALPGVAARPQTSSSTWCSVRPRSRSIRTSSGLQTARGLRLEDTRAVEEALLATTPEAYRKNAHHWLLLHGRYVCTARKPACPKCIIEDLCEYRHKTPPGDSARPRRKHPMAR